MRILVLGKGGREHALAWHLARRRPGSVWVAPGNPGMQAAGLPVVPEAALDPASVARLAQGLEPDLVIVGPEEPLVQGAADALAQAGVPVLGPPRSVAALEGSKAFAKAVMQEAGVPTAPFRLVDGPTQLEAAVRELGGAVALKADGLAQGKGVQVTSSPEEALREGRRLLARFGRLVVEEQLLGTEVSLLVLTDGERYLPFPLAKDHKRRFEGDRGPNTGGMGAVAPAGDRETAERLAEVTVAPVLDLLRRRGTPYRGVLYAGLILTAEGPKVLEYNVRFGDPEAEAVLPLVSEDLAPLYLQAAVGRLDGGTLTVSGQAAVAVVVCEEGYPTDVRKGAAVTVDGDPAPGSLFWAGVGGRPGALRVEGGRLAVAVGVGEGPKPAAERAYALVRRIRFRGAAWREDIGWGPGSGGSLGGDRP